MILDRWRIAIAALGRYKLRTALSVLGVVLGVAGVIAMMSVTAGARQEALDQVASLGLDNLVVRARQLPPDEAAATRSTGLVASDVAALLRDLPLAVSAAPLVERFVPMAAGGTRQMAGVIGTTAVYQSILHAPLASGRALSMLDDRDGTRVCLMGSALGRRLFGFAEPVGQWVRINSEAFMVVGRMAPAQPSESATRAMAWRDLDEDAIVPISALTGRSLAVAPGQRVDEIWVQIADGARAAEVGAVLTHTMLTLHAGTADVDVIVPRELLAERYRTQRTFSVVVGSVAAMALVIGGIGVMNVMLTSVMERTREIGLRRTVGATRRDIGAQFLIEALLMTFAGGAAGIGLGAIVAWGITAYAGWATHLAPAAIGLGLFVSIGTGLVFGWYPAREAARLAPVEAVHFE